MGQGPTQEERVEIQGQIDELDEWQEFLENLKGKTAEELSIAINTRIGELAEEKAELERQLEGPDDDEG